MKPIHLLACLLATFFAVLDLVALTGFRSSYDTPLMIFTGLAMGQLALLAIWCVLGTGSWPARMVVTLAGVAWLSYPLGKVTGHSGSEWFIVLCLIALGTGVAIWMGRLFGIGPGVGRASGGAQVSQAPKRFSQFSLGGLLSLMTVVALVLGLKEEMTFPFANSLAIGGYGVWFVAIAWVALWAYGSQQLMALRLAVIMLACLAAGFFMARTENFQGTWYFASVVAIEAIVISVGLAIFESAVNCAAEEDVSDDACCAESSP